LALKSTIYKAHLDVSDVDNGYYAEHPLTLARHPSETDERMMIRLVAFALQAYQLQAMCNGDGQLTFGAGLSDPNEPDVWLRDLTGQTKLWVEVGQPDEKPIMRACGKADEVAIYCYAHASPIWWEGVKNKVSRPRNLSVYQVDPEVSQTLKVMAQRSMRFSAIIQEGILSMNDGDQSLEVRLTKWR
jgi:uncharacterized protein YaeQ